jgi:GNAT superfamily N-acetyltransferase
MNEITVRPATADDLEAIVASNLALAQETEARQLERETVRSGVRRLLTEPSWGVYYLAELNGRVIGQVLITYEWSDWRDGMFWWIQSVYVAPAARNRGVYRALHTWIERKARQTPGVCGLRLYVDRHNARARQVYARLGLQRTEYCLYESDWSGCGQTTEVP